MDEIEDKVTNEAELPTMEELLAGSFPKEGEISQARVLSQSPRGWFVDVGLKQEGLLPFSDVGKSPLKVGDQLSVLIRRVEGPGGHPLVSWREARLKLHWKRLEDAWRQKQPVEGKIIRHVKGGLLVDMGLEAFMPASQIDRRPVKDFSPWLNQTVKLLITEMDRARSNVVVSRRSFIEKELAERREETLKSLEAGQVRKGRVTGVTVFGAFIDVGGVEGLLHVSDVAWTRTNRVKDVLKVGQEMDVKVLKVDSGSGKISLSRKHLLPHPWDEAEKNLKVGSDVSGKVTGLTPFGAFVEVFQGVEGLVHISEISWTEQFKHPQEAVKVGQDVRIRVLSMDRKKQKISLSIKRVESNPWEEIEETVTKGDHVKGIVSRLVPFGAFVRLPNGIEGLLHASDFSWGSRSAKSEGTLKVGAELELVVLELNPAEEKISLGLKQLTDDPFGKYRVGLTITGRVVRILDFGAFVELEPDIEGLVHISEIPLPESTRSEEGEGKKRLTHPGEVLSIGQEVSACIIKINQRDRKIDLSIRRQDKKEQKEALRKYKTPVKHTLADVTEWGPSSGNDKFSEGGS